MLGFVGFIKKNLDMQGKLPEKWGGTPIKEQIFRVVNGGLQIIANKPFLNNLNAPFGSGSVSNYGYYYSTEDFSIAVDDSKSISTIRMYYPQREDGTSYARLGKGHTISMSNNLTEVINGTMSYDEAMAALAANSYQMDLYGYSWSYSPNYSTTYYYTRLYMSIPGTTHSWATDSNASNSETGKCFIGTVTVSPTDITKIVKFVDNPNWKDADYWIGATD